MFVLHECKPTDGSVKCSASLNSSFLDYLEKTLRDAPRGGISQEAQALQAALMSANGMPEEAQEDDFNALKNALALIEPNSQNAQEPMAWYRCKNTPSGPKITNEKLSLPTDDGEWTRVLSDLAARNMDVVFDLLSEDAPHAWTLADVYESAVNRGALTDAPKLGIR